MNYYTAAMLLLSTISNASSVSHRRYNIGFDKYHNYMEMTNYLVNITQEFSNISSLYSIGKSVQSKYIYSTF